MRAKEILGRDLRSGELGIAAIASIINEDEKARIIGTCACVPEKNTWKARCFCRVRNFLFRIGMIKGSNGILFVSRGLFKDIGGYDESRNTFEHIDLIKRALVHGASWIYLQDVYVQISMRRYECKGYFRTILWWTYEAVRYKLGFQSRKWTSAGHFKKK